MSDDDLYHRPPKSAPLETGTHAGKIASYTQGHRSSKFDASKNYPCLILALTTRNQDGQTVTVNHEVAVSWYPDSAFVNFLTAVQCLPMPGQTLNPNDLVGLPVLFHNERVQGKGTMAFNRITQIRRKEDAQPINQTPPRTSITQRTRGGEASIFDESEE